MSTLSPRPVKRRIGMASWCLILAFVGAGVASLTGILHSWGLPENIPHLELMWYIPATGLGLVVWKRRTGKDWGAPLLLAVLLPLVGLLWVDPTERGRGLLIAASLSMVLPLSLLIKETRSHLLCVVVFLGSSAMNLLLTLVYSAGQGEQFGRMGTVILEDYGRVTNANQFGGQMAAATVLTLALGVALFRLPREQISRSVQFMRVLVIGSVGAFTFGVVASASRGALSALSISVATLIVFAAINVTKKAVLCCLVIGSMGIFFPGSGVLDRVLTRVQDVAEVRSAGDRLPIWESALSTWLANGRFLLIGVGTGGVDKAVVENSTVDLFPVVGQDMIARKSAHSTYVEWGLSYGVCGMLIGAALLVSLFQRSWKADRRDQNYGRIALLTFYLVISLTNVTYRAPYAIGFQALLLAYLLPSRRPLWKHRITGASNDGGRSGRRSCVATRGARDMGRASGRLRHYRISNALRNEKTPAQRKPRHNGNFR